MGAVWRAALAPGPHPTLPRSTGGGKRGVVSAQLRRDEQRWPISIRRASPSRVLQHFPLPMVRPYMNQQRVALGVCLCAALVVLMGTGSAAFAQDAKPDHPWVTYPGKDGPGKGKTIVFVTGDDEYHSEEGMPVMARILAERHGFTCTVLFAINKQNGQIDTNTKDNIPGLEALDHADLMVLFTRFRSLPPDQMKHIIDFVDSGHPVIGIRTATHAFAYTDKNDPDYKYNWNNSEGGFGRMVLGETWINHWGHHGRQATRALIAPGAESNPILRGIKTIWVQTDVYQVRLPMQDGITPLMLGQVLTGMDPNDGAAEPQENSKTHQKVDQNNPMMPVAWTREYKSPEGKTSRVFTTTMGGFMAKIPDWDSEPMRRLLVNACYWCVGMEDKIPEKSDVDLVPGGDFKRGVRPLDVTP